jgi:ribonuclease P protein component
MLPPHARLASSRGFKAVYGRGRSYVTDLIVVYVLPRPGGNRIRIGFVAGKKVGIAVLRNRAKRLMREAARALLPEMIGSHDIVIVGRRGVAITSLARVQADLVKLLTRAGVLSGAGE